MDETVYECEILSEADARVLLASAISLDEFLTEWDRDEPVCEERAA